MKKTDTTLHRDILPPESAARLAEEFGVGEWLEWRRTPKGSSNVSFFVTTRSGDYVLRRSNDRKTVESIRFEVALLDYLRKRDYPAPELVPTRSGEGYVEEERLYLMTRLIPGEPYDAENPNHLLEVGRSLGRFHNLVQGFAGPVYRKEGPGLLSLGADGTKALFGIEPFARQFLTEAEVDRLWEGSAYVADQIGSVGRDLDELSARLDRRIIQGSFGRSALIFDGDSLTGVVDYDRATEEVRGVDLAYTFKAFCRVHDDSSEDFRIGLDLDRCRDLMHAYREVEPLPPDEIRALPLIFRGQRLMKVCNKCQNFLRKNAIQPQEQKDVKKVATIIEREAVRLRWLEDRRESLVSVLLS